MTDPERNDPQRDPTDEAPGATVTRLDAYSRADGAGSPDEPTPWDELDGPFRWDPLDAA